MIHAKRKTGVRMIYPKPSKDCDKCQIEEDCSCECHKSDVINCRHYEVRREEFSLTVKPEVNLDHFRD